MNFPITVNDITFKEDDSAYSEKTTFGGKCGDVVSVRPCGEEYDNKTFLGILLGEIALTAGCSFDDKTGNLELYSSMHNPAIFVPKLNKVIFGCGSWWDKIKSGEQLKEITDEDISSQWYVKALKQVTEEQDGKHNLEQEEADQGREEDIQEGSQTPPV